MAINLMNFTEITLQDKPFFDKCLKQHNPQASELTFTNLFVWRYYYKFRYAIINGLLCLIALPAKSEPYALMPIGDLTKDSFSKAIHSLKNYFIDNGWRLVFKKVSANDLEYFKENTINCIDFSYDRDNSDYIYLLTDLVSLRGKRFDGKRNHINRFKNKHTYEYVPLDLSLVKECSRIMDNWCRDKNCACREGDYCERLANMELLNNYQALECRGALIKVNGSYEAFTVGEMLNTDTVVIHIEKADTKIDGLYPLINQQFCEREWKDAVYINREQDLGLEGMRKAKMSYHPIKMIDKFTVYMS